MQIDMGGFTPAELHIPTGRATTVRLVNPDSPYHSDGGGVHQFAVPDLGIDVKVQPRSSAVFTLVAPVSRSGDAASLRGRWLLIGGAIYILGIFLTYLALGLGLFGVLQVAKSLSGTHLVSRLAAFGALGLGLLAIQEALLPELGAPLASHVDMLRLRGLVSRLRAPGLFAAGALAGLCTVHCSGAVYLAVLSLLAAQGTLWTGLGYLVVYNVAFVLPLAAILALAGSPPFYRGIARWQLHHRSSMKLATGAIAIGIGLLTLAVE
jgi:cytochrome c biogenesis protein CcdA